MKTCYVDMESRSIADLIISSEFGLKGYHITRINVPKASRGKGIARKLFQQILDDADKDQVLLTLEIFASDGLSQEELEAWYTRHGFRWSTTYVHLMVRRPKEKI